MTDGTQKARDALSWKWIFVAILAALLAIAISATILTVISDKETPKSSQPKEVSAEATPSISQSEPSRRPSAAPTRISNDSQDVTSKTDTTLLIAALLGLSLATFISVSISFYLYKWRRILLSNPHMVVPEEWAGYLVGVGAKTESLDQSHQKLIDKLQIHINEIHDKIGNTTETFMSLQAVLDERDGEIRRLKRGYDREIFQKFIYRFVRVDQTIDDLLAEGASDSESLVQVKTVLEDAFAECGVESYMPPLGEDYRTRDDVADHPKKMVSKNHEDVGMIAEVIEAGYRQKTSNGYDIIQPAKVRVFVLDQ